MAPEDPHRRSGTPEPRDAGSAQPVPPRRSTRQPDAPPSFTPETGRRRPGDGPPPVVVGRPPAPTGASVPARRPDTVPPAVRPPGPPSGGTRAASPSRPPAPLGPPGPVGTRRQGTVRPPVSAP